MKTGKLQLVETGEQEHVEEQEQMQVQGEGKGESEPGFTFVAREETRTVARRII